MSYPRITKLNSSFSNAVINVKYTLPHTKTISTPTPNSAIMSPDVKDAPKSNSLNIAMALINKQFQTSAELYTYLETQLSQFNSDEEKRTAIYAKSDLSPPIHAMQLVLSNIIQVTDKEKLVTLLLTPFQNAEISQIKDTDNNQPMHFISRFGSIKEFETAKKIFGADGLKSQLLAANNIHDTPLHQLCSANYPHNEIQWVANFLNETKLTQDERKKLFQQNKMSKNPLHLFAENQKLHKNKTESAPKNTIELMSKLADDQYTDAMKAEDNEGNTPLHLAADSNDVFSEKTYYRAHAFLHFLDQKTKSAVACAKNKKGEMPSDIAQRKDDRHLTNSIASHQVLFRIYDQLKSYPTSSSLENVMHDFSTCIKNLLRASILPPAPECSRYSSLCNNYLDLRGQLNNVSLQEINHFLEYIFDYTIDWSNRPACPIAAMLSHVYYLGTAFPLHQREHDVDELEKELHKEIPQIAPIDYVPIPRPTR